ncbi:MAG TPA: ATP-binding protein [Opitutales bacterium]|nr:ATP-binding protein [Opitutales bacterium]
MFWVIPFVGLASLFGATAKGEPAVRELLVGVYNNPPQVFWDEDEKPAGFYIDFLVDLAERESWKLRFRAGSFSELMSLLEKGEIDLLPSVALSYERSQRFDFGRIPVMENWAVLHRREDVVIHNVFDLEGKTVYGMEGGIHMQAFLELIERYDVDCELVGAPSYDAAMLALEKGDGDAAVVNRTFSTRESGNYETVASSFIFNPIPLHFAVPKDRHRDIIHALDRELAAQKRDHGSVLQLAMNRWMKPEVKTVVPAWLSLAAALLAAGIIGLFVLNRTLTMMVRRRTRELEREKENTVEALRSQNLFLATMSHELRTPLNYLRGSMEMLRDELPEEVEAKEAFNVFERGVDRLEHLFISLLRFADVDREDFEPKLEAVDLHGLVNEIYETAAILPRDEEVALEFECELAAGDQARTDPNAVFQIVVNLLHNAIKFTRQGSVRFRAGRERSGKEDFLKLQVTDTGIGIPPRELQSILIPFKKGTAVDFVEEGSGLGLSIVDRLLKILDGEMQVRSEMGKGSSFTVTIPLKS